ncbi:MAG: MotA/TolQ/ExbB proton channel family protein [Thiotrichaceae bacterium]|nr:MotA/TolQ/ExbB proton channel family protein [Thiotrichaceae bacterium]
MIEFVKSGGFLILPILISSVLALAIIIERFLSLNSRRIMPEKIIRKAHKIALEPNPSANSDIPLIAKSSLIGKILASGLQNSSQPRHIMKESLEETGRHAAHQMDKYMTALGTIATITPLLGLLGTVIGMIQVFSVITELGVGSPTDLAGGISTALITTATGISVAVPALIFHRYYKGKINDYVVRMEYEASKLIELTNSPNKRTVAEKPRPAAPTRNPNAPVRRRPNPNPRNT